MTGKESILPISSVVWDVQIRKMIMHFHWNWIIVFVLRFICFCRSIFVIKHLKRSYEFLDIIKWMLSKLKSDELRAMQFFPKKIQSIYTTNDLVYTFFCREIIKILNNYKRIYLVWLTSLSFINEKKKTQQQSNKVVSSVLILLV